MAGTLFVVATPIGNLEDITFRAAPGAAGSAARRRRGHPAQRARCCATSGSAPRAASASTSTTRRRAAAVVVAAAGAGESVALVTDAGTPAVSDPGAKLVRGGGGRGVSGGAGAGRQCGHGRAVGRRGRQRRGSRSLGFPPARGKDRKSWFASAGPGAAQGPVVVFEAPHRIVQTLEELDVLLNDQIIVFRELTKLHESRYRGPTAEILGADRPRWPASSRW